MSKRLEENRMKNIVDIVGRLLLGGVFLMAGINKIGAYAGTQGYMASQGVSGNLLPLVIVLEIVGAVLLLIGWKARYAAMALAVFTVVAALLFHLNFANQVQSIMFMKNMLITGGLLMIVAHGVGQYSVDR